MRRGGSEGTIGLVVKRDQAELRVGERCIEWYGIEQESHDQDGGEL